jgi:expansin (peptidoglycan-binding protein)
MFSKIHSFSLFNLSVITMTSFTRGLVVPFAGPSDSALTRRGLSGHATWFNVGLGSCGQTSVDTDMIVALATPVAASGSHCGKQVHITASDGTTAQATVMDTCPGCAAGDLDMSPALFKKFNDLGKGVFDITWDFV